MKHHEMSDFDVVGAHSQHVPQVVELVKTTPHSVGAGASRAAGWSRSFFWRTSRCEAQKVFPKSARSACQVRKDLSPYFFRRASVTELTATIIWTRAMCLYIEWSALFYFFGVCGDVGVAFFFFWENLVDAAAALAVLVPSPRRRFTLQGAAALWQHIAGACALYRLRYSLSASPAEAVRCGNTWLPVLVLCYPFFIGEAASGLL